jgi:hypothetical protein
LGAPPLALPLSFLRGMVALDEGTVDLVLMSWIGLTNF